MIYMMPNLYLHAKVSKINNFISSVRKWANDISNIQTEGPLKIGREKKKINQSKQKLKAINPLPLFMLLTHLTQIYKNLVFFS